MESERDEKHFNAKEGNALISARKQDLQEEILSWKRVKTNPKPEAIFRFWFLAPAAEQTR